MRITRIKAYEGRNIYSHFPVVAMLVDLGRYDGRKTSELPGFKDLLLEALPGLRGHHCASPRQGGFVRRLEDGTFLGHVIEHAALELESLAGWKVVYGRTRQTGQQGLYNVVFECGSIQGGVETGRRAVDIVQAVANGRRPEIERHLADIKRVAEEAALGPSTAALAAEALRRGIPVRRVGQGSFLILGHGSRQRRVCATVTSGTTCPAVDLAADKTLTKEVLAGAGVPVPAGQVVGSRREAVKALGALGPPVVVKPVEGNQGRGVSVNLTRAAEVRRAYDLAAAVGPRVLVERHVAGRNYRLLVVDGRLVAAAERLPARVTGDGQRMVRELVEEANRDPLRGEGHQRPLTRLVIDQVSALTLDKQGLKPDVVPESGRTVILRENANLSTGGTARDAIDEVHPDNARLAVRVSRLVGLDVAGVDVVTPDIGRPIASSSGPCGAVIEVNAAPGLRMHLHPSEGRPRDVAAPILDSLFSPDPGWWAGQPVGRRAGRRPDAVWLDRGPWAAEPGRIPVVAVTGTNGKTTVARLIAHVLAASGLVVGLASTDGAWVGGEKVLEGDCAGPLTASAILSDPAVEAAVLETARGGILRDGLAFDRCDVGLVTNISADHEGRDGLESLEDIAYVKALVVEAVARTGHAVLNADDPFVHNMAGRARGDVVFFSRNPGNVVVRKHVLGGGRAVYLAGESIVAEGGADGGRGGGQGSGLGGPGPTLAGPVTVARLGEVPLTLGGLLPFQVENAIAAVAAAWSLGVPVVTVRRALRTFGCQPARSRVIDAAVGGRRSAPAPGRAATAAYALNPGRFQVWRTNRRVTVVLDYGHNRAAYAEALGAASRLCRDDLHAVVGAPGDRLDEHLLAMGRLAARTADRLVIKEDADTRGRARGEVASLFLRGVLDTGFPEARVDVLLDERAALERALERARPGDWVVVFYEKLAPLLESLATVGAKPVPWWRLLGDERPSCRRAAASRGRGGGASVAATATGPVGPTPASAATVATPPAAPVAGVTAPPVTPAGRGGR